HAPRAILRPGALVHPAGAGEAEQGAPEHDSPNAMQETRGNRGRPKRSTVRNHAVALALAAALAGGAAGPPAAGAQARLPKPVGWINDLANIIEPERERQIQAVIDEVRAKSGGEIVVVTLPTLLGRTAPELALQLGREWGVGRAGEPGDTLRNTGVVVLVVPRETSDDGRGHARIETGLGTPFITAAEAGRILDDFMIPRFREGDYGTGILLGVVAIAREYAERFGFELTGEVPREIREPEARGGPTAIGVIVLAVVIVIILMALRRGGGGGRGGFRGGGRGRRFRGPIFIPFPIGGSHRGGWG